MNASVSANKSYSLTGVEKTLNQAIRWVFFYRMLFVGLAVVLTAVAALLVWRHSSSEYRAANLMAVLSGGSIVIAVFYAVLNYEMSYSRYEAGQLSVRKQAAYAAAIQWYQPSVVHHLKVSKKFYEKYRYLIQENRSREFSEMLDSHEEARAALLSIFNHLECIALGVEEGIHDEWFIRQFFRGIFVAYLNDYEFYIVFRRKLANNPSIWVGFTDLAHKWRHQ